MQHNGIDKKKYVYKNRQRESVVGENRSGDGQKLPFGAAAWNKVRSFSRRSRVVSVIVQGIFYTKRLCL